MTAAAPVYRPTTDRFERPTGRCRCCPYTIRLRVSGVIQTHRLWVGDEQYVCNGSGRPPKPTTDRLKETL